MNLPPASYRLLVQTGSVNSEVTVTALSGVFVMPRHIGHLVVRQPSRLTTAGQTVPRLLWSMVWLSTALFRSP
jgi:hypothetical protein